CAADRRPREAAGVSETDPRPPAGAARAGARLHEPHFQRTDGRGALLGSAPPFDQPAAGRAARRGLPEAPVLQGPDAGSDVGHVVPDLRARARAADGPAEPGRAGLDPQHVRGPAPARQPPSRPPRAAHRRLVGPRSAGRAQRGAGPGGLADAVHRRVSPRLRAIPPNSRGIPAFCTQSRASRSTVYFSVAPKRGGGGMADALVSGASDRKVVEVQLLSAAPTLS